LRETSEYQCFAPGDNIMLKHGKLMRSLNRLHNLFVFIYQEIKQFLPLIFI